MRKLAMVLVTGAILFGLVGAAAAEGGSIVPWSKTSSAMRPTAGNGSVLPLESGTILPW